MGEVIPFKWREPRETEPPIVRYYGDLAAVEDIVADLAYPAIITLLTGLLLNVLHKKNGGNCAADLADLKEFARGVRQEIKLQGGSNGTR